MADKIFGLGMGTFALMLLILFTQRDKIKSMLKRG